MKKRLIWLLLSGFLLSLNLSLTTLATNRVLWEKKPNGFVGENKVANNGNILFLCKPQETGIVTDLVAINEAGDYYWHKRYVNKIRDFLISPSGKMILLTALQPRQKGYLPMISCIKERTEIWQKPGGEYLSLSPGERMILSFNQKTRAAGVYLYNWQGDLIWKSKELALGAGQADDAGRMITGINQKQVVFIDTTRKDLEPETYPIETAIKDFAFDPQNRSIFIYDGQEVSCYQQGKGKVWDYQAKEVQQIKVHPQDYKVTLLTHNKGIVLPYNNISQYYNIESSIPAALQQLRTARVLHSFSDNRKYLGIWREGKVSLNLVQR